MVLGDTEGGTKKGVRAVRPLKRKPVNKRRSAGKFRKHAGKTKSANVKGAPMRGGIRL